MRCVKQMSEREIAQNFDHQVAELQMRVDIFNRFMKIGTLVTLGVG